MEPQDLELCLFRIIAERRNDDRQPGKRRKENTLGTGFFIWYRDYKALALTCWHVINPPSHHWPLGKVLIEYQGDIYEAMIILIYPKQDLVMLEVDIKDKDVKVVSIDPKWLPGDLVYVSGFQEQDKFAKPVGINSSIDQYNPHVHVLFQDDDTRQEVINLTSDGIQFRKGMSGAPILNRRTKKVCAVETGYREEGPEYQRYRGYGIELKHLYSVGEVLSSGQELDMSIPALLREGGLAAIYVPSTNAERNVRKETAVREAEQQIKLLAITGHSYLAMVGSRFKGALVQRLRANVPVQIILLNPWTDSGFLIALGELSEGPSTEIQKKAFELLKKGQSLTGFDFDPVALIKDSVYYRYKYPESIEGYRDLKKQFRNSIELRLSAYEIAATMLLTEKTGFFEPYIHVNLPERMRNLMLTFELEFSNKSYFYRHCLAYFDVLWKLSVPYEEFLETEDKWQAQLRDKYE